LIDHVWYANEYVGEDDLAFKIADGENVAPVWFKSEADALANLIPTDTMPSDHYPVVVSFAVGVAVEAVA
jgi:hypothetical protein